MFESDLLDLQNWLCQNTRFKPVENTFDDRYVQDGFLIKPDLFIQFISVGSDSVKAIQKCSIYIQYIPNDDDKLKNLVANLLNYFQCSNSEIISIDIDSKEVFEELTKNAKKFNSENFRFASLNINFSLIITPESPCDPC